MNVFTKEELEIIDHALFSFITLRDHLKKYKSIFLRHKIHSMIDNYCDHEWQESIHDCDLKICIKCGIRGHWSQF